MKNPVRNSAPKELYNEEDETRVGPPSKSDLPPPLSGQRGRVFDENDETRTGLPTKSNLPPPLNDARPDPQDAVDPDEAVTVIADPPRTRSRSQ